jgi:hypothetical protein
MLTITVSLVGNNLATHSQLGEFDKTVCQSIIIIDNRKAKNEHFNKNKQKNLSNGMQILLFGSGIECDLNKYTKQIRSIFIFPSIKPVSQNGINIQYSQFLVFF